MPAPILDDDSTRLRILRDFVSNEHYAWQCINKLCLKVYQEPTGVCGICGSVVKGCPF